MDDLVLRAKNGDMQAFEQIVLQYEKLVYNIAYKIFSNAEDAKDVSQDVFIKLYRNISKYEGTSSFKTWLYTIAYNTCIDEIRKRKKAKISSMDKMIEGDENNFERQFASNEPTPEQQVLIKEEISAVERAINKLNEDHKMIIVLRDIRQLSYDEIVQITGLSLGTVKSRINRARKKLKEFILVEQNES